MEPEIRFDELTEKLQEIADYKMPKFEIKHIDVTRENMADLMHCIQDMAGKAEAIIETMNKKTEDIKICPNCYLKPYPCDCIANINKIDPRDIRLD